MPTLYMHARTYTLVYAIIQRDNGSGGGGYVP